MQLIIVLAIIVIIALFFVFNLQSVTLIFFGGVMTVKFPLAIWVLLFTLTGIISSLTLQFLYGFGRVSPQSRFKPSNTNSNPPQPFPSPRTPPRVERSPEVEQRPPIVSSTEADDWDIEVPPAQPTAPRNIDYVERRQVPEPSQTWERESRERGLETTEFPQPRREYIERRQVPEPQQDWENETRFGRLETTESVDTVIQQDLEKPKKEYISPRQDTNEPSYTRDNYIEERIEENTTFEVQRPPQSVSRTGSIYSYTYREAKKIPRDHTEQKNKYQEEKKPQSKNNTNRVYDADFRVITPPYRQEEGDNQDFRADDDEDWI